MIKPLSNRVLVQMIEPEETTKSGIILSAGSKEQSQIAKVIEVGPGINTKETKEPMYVKPGQKVIINKYSGSEIKFEGEDFIILKQDDILAIIE